MAQVRALYEDSAVPVRDIARRAGVTERTLYKYARKNNWKPRYAWTPDGSRPPGRPARRRWSEARERAMQFAPAKGAGGRFIRRDDIGKPFATGIKALDPAGRAAAVIASAEAARMAEMARLEAVFARAASNSWDALRALKQAADETGVLRPAWWPPLDPLAARVEATYLNVVVDWVTAAAIAFEGAGVALHGVPDKAAAPVTSAPTRAS
jgi:hypothetical protein